MSKKSYYVTDVQGARPEVAGKRRTIGERITLTDPEAEFEVLRGTVLTQEQYDAKQAQERAAAPTTAPAPAKPGK